MEDKKEFNNVNPNNFRFIEPYFRFNRNMNFSGINTVVLHWTAGSSVDSDIKSLKRQGYGYHFIIDREGNIYQGAPVEKRLSHSGYSYGPKGTGLNQYSIGVSFSMRGSESAQKGSTKFNDKQIDACVSLLLDLKEALPTLKFVTGHHWVSPRRKIDPYTLDYELLLNKSLNGKTLKSVGYEVWKTGYKPFPKGLKDCVCLKEDEMGNCLESRGDCIGQGGHKYSERRLTSEVRRRTITTTKKDTTLGQSDQETD